MDADGSHQPEQLHRLLDALADADLVIGSRWVPGRLGRQLAAAPRAALARRQPLRRGCCSASPVRDATAGFRLFRRATLEAIDLDVGRSPPATSSRPTWRSATLRAGLRVREVPIEFVERERGDSKMSGSVATESLRADHRAGACASAAPGSCAAAPRVTGVEPRRRRRRRSPAAAAARAGRCCFIGVPLVEIYVIIQVGQVIGAVVDDPAAGRRQHPRRLADQARGRPRLAGAAATALDSGPDAGHASSPTAR